MSQNFNTLSLSPALLKNLDSLGYHSMTPVQEKTLPLILEGRDVIGRAQTGSGKTAAFGLGLLQKLDTHKVYVQAIVLCPTRELADQVAKEIRTLARTTHNVKVLTLCGGTPFRPQAESLSYGAHIIVGTPGRVHDHIRRETIKLSSIHTIVLDEADRMLEMGFQDDVDAVVDGVPAERQTLLFSATFAPQMQAIAKKIMNYPATVEIAAAETNDNIEQQFFKVSDSEQRQKALQLLLLQHMPESAVVFCKTKKDTDILANTLDDLGFSALAINGDLEQRERDQALAQFANKSITVLVATDVAARGLDIEKLDLVINYHVAHDPEVHIHRVGRTGRAGNKGLACTLFDEREQTTVSFLQESQGLPTENVRLPSDDTLTKTPRKALMRTLQIDGGKKQKLRAGDILGALTSENGIEGKQVGKIQLADRWAFVAVEAQVAKVALQKIATGKMKGRSFRARML